MVEGYKLAEVAAIYWQAVRELRRRAEFDWEARALLELIETVRTQEVGVVESRAKGKR